MSQEICTTGVVANADWPGHFKITDNASVENSGEWTGTGYVKTGSTDGHFLLVDGTVISSKQKVWYVQNIPVEKCATYNFSALVNNIDVNTIKPSEVPKVSLLVDGLAITQQTMFQNQAAWNQLGGTWKSSKDGNVELAVLLDGGGWVGRDIGIDEISFTKVSCSDLNTGSRTCNAVASVGHDMYICSGASAQIGDNNTSTTGLTYQWTSDDNSFTSTDANPSVSPTKTTVYTLVVTDATNGCSATDKVTVYIISPSVSISTVANSCNLTFTANPFSGVPDPQYKWYVNGTAVETSATGTFAPQNIKMGDVVKCQLISQCSVSPFSNEITVTDEVAYADAGADKTICSGTTVQIGSTSVAGVSYSWSPVTDLDNSAISNPQASPGTSTTYTVTATYTNGCIMTDAVTVTVNASPTPGTITVGPATTVCSGQYVNVGVSYGSDTYTYTGPSLINGGGGGGQGGFGYAGYAYTSGDFVLTKTNAAGCSTVTSVHLTVQSSVAITTGSVSTSLCTGLPVAVPFTVNGCAILNSGNVFTAQLSDASGNFTSPVSIGTLTGTTSGVISAVIPSTIPSGGNYRIRVISSNTASRGSDNGADITINSSPDPGTISVSPSTTVCSGQSISVGVNYGTGPYTFTQPPLSNQNGGGGPGGFGFGGIAYTSGDFVLTKTNAAGCSTVTSVHLTVNPTPLTPVVTATGTLICQGGRVSLSTGTGYSFYQWKLNSTNISGATASSYITNQAGSYTVTVTNNYNCSATSAATTLNSSSLQAPRVSVDRASMAYCASSNTTLRVGEAIQLNGSNQYVNVPGFSWPYPASNPITVEFWTKVNTSDVNYSSAFTIGNADNPNRIQAHVPWIDKQLYWDYGATGRIQTDFTPYLDKWVHVALVSAGNGGSFRAIYINGNYITGIYSASDGPDINLSGLMIGHWQYYDKGMIDEFRVWNKVLSQAEIQASMNTVYGNGTANLMGSWGFDEVSGTTVYDDKGIANGTIVNNAPRVYPSSPLTYTWYPSSYLNSTSGTSVVANPPVTTTYIVAGVDGSGCSNVATTTVIPIGCKVSAQVNAEETLDQDWLPELYPNPSEGVVNLTIKNAYFEEVSVEVINLNGVTVYKNEQVNTEQAFAFGGELQSGMYMVRVSNNKENKILKLVITR